MFLGFTTEYVHLVLIQALVAAELDLVVAILEVHVIDGVTRVFAPITDLVTFERRAPTLGEANFAAEHLAARRRVEREKLAAGFLTPAAFIGRCRRFLHDNF